MKTTTLLKLLSCLFALHSSSLLAESADCKADTSQAQVAEATASIWANSIKRADSLRVVAAKSVNSKLAELTADSSEMIHVTIEPKKVLSDYSEYTACKELLAKTEKSPFRVRSKQFTSADDLNNWISEFSQGENKEGERLYSECPGRCSPRYRYLIRKKESRLILEAEAICGHARDKDDNLYKIAASPCKTNGAVSGSNTIDLTSR